MYSLPYILLLAFYGYLALKYHYSEEKDRTTMQVICMASYLFFFGFRGLIGTDWIIYYPEYEHFTIDSLFNLSYSLEESIFEPGFAILMYLCKQISDSFTFFTFVCTLIDTLLLFRFLSKRTDNLPLTLLIYICMGGFSLQVNLLRNFISILIFLNALEFIEQKRPIPYFLLCLLALSFHVSSLIFIPLYFILNRPWPKWLFITAFIIGNVFILFQIHIVGPLIVSIAGQLGETYAKMADAYIEGVYADINKGITIGYFERIFTGFLILCYYEKLKTIRKENIIFINSFLLYISLYLVFSEFAVFAERAAFLFIFSYWILWPDLLKCFNIRNNRILFAAFLTMYCLLKIIGNTNLPAFEYDNVLFGAKSYEERSYIYYKNLSDE